MTRGSDSTTLRVEMRKTNITPPEARLAAHMYAMYNRDSFHGKKTHVGRRAIIESFVVNCEDC